MFDGVEHKVSFLPLFKKCALLFQVASISLMLVGGHHTSRPVDETTIIAVLTVMVCVGCGGRGSSVWIVSRMRLDSSMMMMMMIVVNIRMMMMMMILMDMMMVEIDVFSVKCVLVSIRLGIILLIVVVRWWLMI